ncbi:hypothetical protein T4C_9842 [Trichinella pseudospiralis]|uniref:Uncharacterized protein n=1 Tax=Trichinella pseudospiralis TaxID=6337 RepID=A0A0V1J9Z1_TRIPS|nr:hypothetical protein T4C_9842 [Trichinella pseudospiralis]
MSPVIADSVPDSTCSQLPCVVAIDSLLTPHKPNNYIVETELINDIERQIGLLLTENQLNKAEHFAENHGHVIRLNK